MRKKNRSFEEWKEGLLLILFFKSKTICRTISLPIVISLVTVALVYFQQ